MVLDNYAVCICKLSRDVLLWHFMWSLLSPVYGILIMLIFISICRFAKVSGYYKLCFRNHFKYKGNLNLFWFKWVVKYLINLINFINHKQDLKMTKILKPFVIKMLVLRPILYIIKESTSSYL